MKNLILLAFAVLTISIISCKKETIYKDVIVHDRDTTFIITRDTVKLIQVNDSLKVGFVYTLSYNADSSMCSLYASSNCKALPSDATYTWSINGDLLVITNKSYLNAGFGTGQSGNYILAMDVYLPDKKAHYIVSTPFTVNIKK
jgi:hypothetical protein